MPARRRSPPRKPSRRLGSGRSVHERSLNTNVRNTAPKDRVTKRWRREVRPGAVRSAASATKTLKWSPRLIEALLEELYVDDRFEELLGRAPGQLRSREYPRAIAVALILRHSWHPDDLACMVERLGLKVKHVGSP